MNLYKVTDHDGESHNGGSGKWTKGRWRSVRGELVPCENGLHLCRRQDLIDWLGPVIWEAEADDSELIDHGNKVVVRKARVVRRLDTWNEQTARLFAADCAEKVRPIYEKQYPNDDRPRKAVDAARAYARGEIGDAARAAARAAAWAAGEIGAAAWAAAWAAARAAARAAAWDATGDYFRQWATERLFDYLEGRAS